MLAKRIIPCLDVKDGRVVKGVNFVRLRDAGDPVENARIYQDEGADELVFLDITASIQKRKTIVHLAKSVADVVFMPFCVGGGIRCIEDIRELLNKGCDKVSLNTSAVRNPAFVKKASKLFGSQCIVVAIDAKRKNRRWIVYINGGKSQTNLDAQRWARKVEQMGAGEILLTSMDRDGTKSGYDIELTKSIAQSVNIPVIASGGCGNPSHIYEVFVKAGADAALAASIFHYRQYSIKEVKKYLKRKGLCVRI